MAKLRNISNDERHIPSLQLTVPPDGLVDIPDDAAAGFAAQGGTWQVSGVEVPDGVPARKGAGSGRDVWAGYAATHGVPVDDADTRDDIIARLDAAGVPTTREEQ